MKTAIIIGGGITGLSTAHYLSKLANHFGKIIVLEAKHHVGGWIQSTRRSNGAVHELGPRSVRPVGDSGNNLLKLVNELSLDEKILSVSRNHPVSKNRLILVNHKLHSIPSGIRGVLLPQYPFTRPLIFSLFKDVFSAKSAVLTDESLYSFCKRRFGDEVADFVADPLCCGVYAGDAKSITVKALVKKIFLAEQKHGSAILGMFKESIQNPELVTMSENELVQRATAENWASWTLQGGLQTLTDALYDSLKANSDVELFLNTPTFKITSKNNKVQVLTPSQEFEGDHIFATLPAANLGRILEESHPVLAKNLSAIEAATVAVVNLEFPNNVLPVKAFGYLVPSNQNYSKMLGVVFDSTCFPSLGGTNETGSRVTAMLGGHWFKSLFGDPDKASADYILDVVKKEIAKTLNITKEPIWQQVTIQKNCIPQYKLGHYELVEECQSYLNKHELSLSLIGASYDGVSVNDCVYNARKEVCKFQKN